MLVFLSKTLERRGIKALTAATAEEGIKIYTENNPDGVFLDLHLPRTDGVQVLKSLKQINPQVKVYFITGDQGFIEKQSAESLSTQGFLFKPITASDIVKIVEGLYVCSLLGFYLPDELQ